MLDERSRHPPHDADPLNGDLRGYVMGTPRPRTARAPLQPLDVFPFLGHETSDPPAVQVIARAPRPESALVDKEVSVVEVIRRALPEAKDLQIRTVRYVRDGTALTAVWRAHRAVFALRGQLDLACQAALVVAALQQGTDGLRAVEVHSSTGDFVVWLSTPEQRILAAHAAFEGALPEVAVGLLT